MSWLYLQESEESSELSATTPGPSLTVKSTRTLKPCSCERCDEDEFLSPRYGTTCELCEGVFFPRWTSSREVSRARISALRESARAWTESEAACFGSLCALPKKLIRQVCFWKTYGQALESTWELSEMRLKNVALKYETAFSPRLISVLRSVGKDGLCWPSPLATDETHGGPNHCNRGKPALSAVAVNPKKWRTWPCPTASDYGTRINRGGSAGRVGKERPTLGALLKEGLTAPRWASPAGRDWKGGKSAHKTGRSSPPLDTQVRKNGLKGYLSPRFHAVMMGFDSDVNVLRPPETQWFQTQPKPRT